MKMSDGQSNDLIPLERCTQPKDSLLLSTFSKFLPRLHEVEESGIVLDEGTRVCSVKPID